MRDEKPAKPEGKSRAVASVKAENHSKLIAIFNESEMQCGFGYADSHVRDEASVDEKQMLTKNSKKRANQQSFYRLRSRGKTCCMTPLWKWGLSLAAIAEKIRKLYNWCTLKPKLRITRRTNCSRIEMKSKVKIDKLLAIWVWWFVACKVVDGTSDRKWCQWKIKNCTMNR